MKVDLKLVVMVPNVFLAIGKTLSIFQYLEVQLLYDLKVMEEMFKQNLSERN